MQRDKHSIPFTPEGDVAIDPAQARDASGNRGQGARRIRYWGRVCVRILLLGLLCGSFFLSVFPQGRAAVHSALLIPSLLAASEPPFLHAVREPIQHIQNSISTPTGTVYLDTYAPTTQASLVPGKRGAVLVISGVGDNRNEPQLINLLVAMAHNGFVVMNITTPTMMAYEISAEDRDDVVLAFQQLTRFPGVGQKRVGVVAFSGGAPLACLGAADPRIRDQVAFVTIFGGYFNISNVLRDFGRRALLIDGHKEPWQPIDIPLQVIANVITKTFTPDERALITSAVAPQGTPLSRDQQASLSPPALAAYHLLQGDQPERVEANMAALSPEIKAQLVALSPSSMIGQVKAPVYLLHDRNDPSLPVTESRDFAATLARMHHPYDYVELHIFDHVQVRSHPDFWQEMGDGLHLFGLLNRLLQIGA